MVINNNYSNRIINSPLANGSILSNSTKTNKPSSTSTGFDDLLKDAISKESGVKFSKHAEMRMQSRNINLTQSQKQKIDDAVSTAKQKGVKDSLVILDNMAFVINIGSKTVITAVNKNELKDNVFTNIDGAIFA